MLGSSQERTGDTQGGGAPRSESEYIMIAGGDHAIIHRMGRAAAPAGAFRSATAEGGS